MIGNTFRTFTILFFLVVGTEISKAQETGYLIIETNVSEFLLVVDDDFYNYLEVSSGDTLALSPGSRNFRMVAPNVNDNLFDTEIFADSIIGISIQFSQIYRVPRSSYDLITSENPINYRIQTDANSEIHIDNITVGFGIYEGLLAPGEHKIRITHPEYGSSNFKINSNLFELGSVSRYNVDPVSAPKAVQFIPGARYVLTKQYGKLAISYFGIALTAVGYSYLDGEFNTKEREHDRIYALYNATESTLEAVNLRNEMVSLRDDMDAINSQSYIVIGVALGIAAYTVYDGFKKPKAGYKIAPARFKPLVSIVPVENRNTLALGGRIQLW
jgi:hypothetical protein